MDIQAPVGSHMLKWLDPRNRKGQQFYNGVAKLARIARIRPYCTPVLFLVIKHYADRFGIVDYINRITLELVKSKRHLQNISRN